MTSPIKPVRRQSVEVQAAESLRESIISGALHPGERLTEIKLSEQLQISRATVRTALHQISKEGLIVQIPYTGWTVMTLSSHDAWELYTLRSSLEALAARLASGQRADVWRGRLEKSYARLASACERRNRGQIADADFGLHKTIVQMSAHRRLAEQYQFVEQQIRIYIASSDSLIADPDAIAAQHRPIVDAILAGEAERAALLAEEHNMVEGEKLVNHLRAEESQEAS